MLFEITSFALRQSISPRRTTFKDNIWSRLRFTYLINLVLDVAASQMVESNGLKRRAKGLCGQRHSIRVPLQQSPIGCKHLITASGSISSMYLSSHRRKSAKGGGKRTSSQRNHRLLFLPMSIFSIGSSAINRPYSIILTVINSRGKRNFSLRFLLWSSFVSDLLFLCAHQWTMVDIL